MGRDSKIVTLLTDFGYRDVYVGTMKGVILGICPEVVLVDLTHGVSPGAVQDAAFLIERSFRYFPSSTLHLTVVDPGVGGQRLHIVISTQGHFFVGPDNGIFTRIVESSERNGMPWKAYMIENPKMVLPERSSTFHGRDVFAPAIAHLATGESPSKMGRRLTDPVRIDTPQVQKYKGVMSGEIVYVDTFGNLVSNISASDLNLPGSCCVYVGRRAVGPIRSSYDAVPSGRPVAIVGGFGLLEISIRNGAASEVFPKKAWKKVAVREKRA